MAELNIFYSDYGGSYYEHNHIIKVKGNDHSLLFT